MKGEDHESTLFWSPRFPKTHCRFLNKQTFAANNRRKSSINLEIGVCSKKLVPIGEGHGRSKVCKSLRCVGMFSLVEKGDSSE